MRTFSISILMLLIVALAVGMAALRYPVYGVGPILGLFLTLLGTSILGIFFTRGLRRAGWAGFLVFGLSYAIAAEGPWFSTEVMPSLPSTKLLAYLNGVLHSDIYDEVRTLSANIAVVSRQQFHQASQRSEQHEKSYYRTGNVLTAILAGLLGAAIGRWLWRTNREDEARETQERQRRLGDRVPIGSEERPVGSEWARANREPLG